MKFRSMPQLAEIQDAIAGAMLGGRLADAPDSLIGGSDPRSRLGIHLRHFDTSLVTALHDKYPATRWLLGKQPMLSATRQFVRKHPPCAPCIAEYGGNFPDFLGQSTASKQRPWLESFANLEWFLGKASISVSVAPAGWREIARIGADLLLDSRFTLQPGMFFLSAAYEIDLPMKSFLASNLPEELALPAKETTLQVKGTRGSFSFRRLEADVFAFRAALAEGRTVSEAAMRALELNAYFDAGEALRALIASNSVVSTQSPQNGKA